VRLPLAIRARYERLAISLVLLILLVLYTRAAGYRLDTLDEGYFVYTSSRVLAGDLPYRDFSTPYTPAFFFLNATLFQLFGLDVVTVRLSQAIARLALLLLVYVLARRLMPPAFAFMPLFVMLAEDMVPGNWAIHPAWWATLLFVLTVWCACRHRESGAAGWWLAAGLAAGGAFAFKQNVGVFALMALAGLALIEHESLRPIRSPRVLMDVARLIGAGGRERAIRFAAPAYLLALSAAIGWLVRAHASPLAIVQFVAPLGALGFEQLATRLRAPERCSVEHDSRLAATLARLILAGAAFAAVTIPWLAALVAILGPAQTPLAAFVGQVDTNGYYLEIDPLRATTVILYLPIASFWAGYALLVSGHVAPADRTLLRWYLLAGGLLYLNQYPRTDEPHLLWSGPLLWIVGAYGLWRVWEWGLDRQIAERHGRFAQIALYAVLMILPLAAVWPNLEIRRQEVITRRPDGPLLFGPPHNLVPLGLARARVYEADEFALKYQQLAAFFREHSQPQDRIFVFPAAPLLYYLVDRPNATRFNHLLPGLLSAEDELESIERLAAVPARYVIWDTFGAGYWLKPDDYRLLERYIWDSYEPVESIGGFAILRKKET
jgi:hypothetical protein